MKDPLISVIVPCYNQAAYIGECLDSVLQQSFTSWECMVVNDGSSDNLTEVIQPFLQKAQRIKYIEQDNRGVSAARNHAIQQSAGTFILPLDGDDILHKDFLLKTYEAFQTHPEAKLVYTHPVLFDKKKGKWPLPAYSYERLLFENMIVVTALFRKADFIIAGGYDENFRKGYEDWEFWIRFLSPADRVIYLNQDLFFYRIKKVSRNAMIDEEKEKELRLKIYEKHRSKFLQHLPDPITLARENASLKQYYRDSRDYRLGHMLLKPLRYIKQLLR